MKILFVHPDEDVQQQWVAPLRAEGWGVVRVRNAEEASRMMIIHGGLQGLAVHESFVPFAEKQSIPYVVVLQNWKEREIGVHQRSKTPALGYFLKSAGPAELIRVFSSGAAALPLPATGTDSSVPIPEPQTQSGVRLQDATGYLRRPEKTKTHSTASLSLKSPAILLGGKAPVPAEVSEVRTGLSLVPEPEAADPVPEELPSLPPLEPVEEIEVLQSAPEETGIVDRTRIDPEIDFSSLMEPTSDSPPGDFSLEQDFRSIADSILSKPAPVETPDQEALKGYLALREQDVAVLSGQLRSSKERIQQLESLLKAEKSRGAEVQEALSRVEQRLKNYDREKQVEVEVAQKQLEDLERQLREKTDKARQIETRLRLTSEEVGKVKDRVRVDIRRIRVREKELEGQLEILKKDSSALLQARDEKILELKRRIDLLEFNMELVQEQYEKQCRQSDELKGKLRDAAQAMKQANGFLDQ